MRSCCCGNADVSLRISLRILALLARFHSLATITFAGSSSNARSMWAKVWPGGSVTLKPLTW